MFELREVWSDAEGKMIRIADVVDKTDDNLKIFYEFKSVIDVPPNKFAEQFIKDLSRRDVHSLDQLKWIFDGKKVDELLQEDFVSALKASKEKLFNSKGKELLEKELGETFIDADDLFNTLSKNKNWFKKVFKKVN